MENRIRAVCSWGWRDQCYSTERLIRAALRPSQAPEGPRPAHPAAERERVLTALIVAMDVYVWKLLRRDLRLDRPAAEAVMVRLVRGDLLQVNTLAALDGEPTVGWSNVVHGAPVLVSERRAVPADLEDLLHRTGRVRT
jgi:hypothetical protein